MKRINLVVMCYGETASFNRTKLIELIGITSDHIRPQCITSVMLVSLIQISLVSATGATQAVGRTADQDKSKREEVGEEVVSEKDNLQAMLVDESKISQLRDDKIRLQPITLSLLRLLS